MLSPPPPGMTASSGAGPKLPAAAPEDLRAVQSSLQDTRAAHLHRYGTTRCPAACWGMPVPGFTGRGADVLCSQNITPWCQQCRSHLGPGRGKGREERDVFSDRGVCLISCVSEASGAARCGARSSAASPAICLRSCRTDAPLSARRATPERAERRRCGLPARRRGPDFTAVRTVVSAQWCDAGGGPHLCGDRVEAGRRARRRPRVPADLQCLNPHLSY